MPSSPADSLTMRHGPRAGTRPEGRGLDLHRRQGVDQRPAIEALAPIETCLSGAYGINVGGGAELKATNDTIIGAARPCRRSKAASTASLSRSAHTTRLRWSRDPQGRLDRRLREERADGRRRGIDDQGLDSTILGEGRAHTAQNGVEVAFGAKGTVKGSSVSGNECELVASAARATSKRPTGVVFYRRPPAGRWGSTIRTTTWASLRLGERHGAREGGREDLQEPVERGPLRGDLLEEGKAGISGDRSSARRLGIAILQAASQDRATSRGRTGPRWKG